jgi:hypothetical protein
VDKARRGEDWRKVRSIPQIVAGMVILIYRKIGSPDFEHKEVHLTCCQRNKYAALSLPNGRTVL